MTQAPVTDPGLSALQDSFHRLETLFHRDGRSDEDLSLCFVCLRWTTGDEGCRRGDRCELQLALDRQDAAIQSGSVTAGGQSSLS